MLHSIICADLMFGGPHYGRPDIPPGYTRSLNGIHYRLDSTAQRSATRPALQITSPKTEFSFSAIRFDGAPEPCPPWVRGGSEGSSCSSNARRKGFPEGGRARVMSPPGLTLGEDATLPGLTASLA
jgi:hypothetical protein